jgi:hypothetical protein
VLIELYENYNSSKVSYVTQSVYVQLELPDVLIMNTLTYT